MPLGRNWLIIFDIDCSERSQLLPALKANRLPVCLAQSMTLCWRLVWFGLCCCLSDQTKQTRGCASKNVCFHIITSMYTSLPATAEDSILLLSTCKHATKCFKATVLSVTWKCQEVNFHQLPYTAFQSCSMAVAA